MSALGHKRTFRDAYPMSALPPKADIAERNWHVRFVPLSDIAVSAGCPMPLQSSVRGGAVLSLGGFSDDNTGHARERRAFAFAQTGLPEPVVGFLLTVGLPFARAALKAGQGSGYRTSC